MSTTDDTVPAAETDNAELSTTSVSDALGGERHQGTRQVGLDDDAPAAAAAAPETPAAPVAEMAPDPATKPVAEQPFWYRKEIEKERKARQAAERALEQTHRQQPPQRQPTVDDDPERPLTRAELVMFNDRQRLIDRLERSEEGFIDKLGEEVFEQTREWLATRPDIEEWALKQRNPWKAAHSQFQKEKLASEIGEDPSAWREAERARIRQELLAEMETERAPAPTAAPQMRPAPPVAASTARAAAPRDNSGRFTGPAPLGATFKHKG